MTPTPSAEPETENRRDAILLVNLGTPDAPTAAAVRRYLAEFLSDRRVIDLPRWLWLPLLYGVILRVRPRRSAHAYASIWTPEGSPLRVYSQALADRLDARLRRAGGGRARVALAMRYGQPSIASVVTDLLAHGMRRLLVVPLYPQYSATSTATVFDALASAFRDVPNLPELRFVNGYHDAEPYIDALAQQVQKFWTSHGRAPRLLLSFHGIPERYARAGDPYFDQCLATARLLRDRLGLGDDTLSVAFQSRVGRERWLQPYTDEVLRALPRQGIRHVQVLCPGFAVDCLETLEEIAIRNREDFLAAGGERLDYIPALNDGDAHVDVLQALVREHARDWLDDAAPATGADRA